MRCAQRRGQPEGGEWKHGTHAARTFHGKASRQNSTGTCTQITTAAVLRPGPASTELTPILVPRAATSRSPPFSTVFISRAIPRNTRVARPHALLRATRAVFPFLKRGQP